MEEKGGVVKEVGERIAKASRAFGMLKEFQPFLQDEKTCPQRGCLGIILYGSETWTTNCFHVRKLDVFHSRCMRTIMGIASVQQRFEHISSI